MSEGCTEEELKKDGRRMEEGWKMVERVQRNRKIRNNKIRIVIFL